MPKVTAVIQAPHSDRHLSVERFFPIFERFAELFQTDIVVRVPETADQAQTDIGALHVNFFYRSTSGTVAESTTTSIFGYPTKDNMPLRCSKYLHSNLPKLPLFDFRGMLVAHRDKQAIFIDFDFLNNSWDGHECVLRYILLYLIPKPLAAAEDGAEFMKFGKRVALALKNDFYSAQYARTNAFTDHYVSSLRTGIAQTRANIQELLNQGSGSELAFVASARLGALLEEYIEITPSRIFSDEELASQFDALMRIPEVGKVEIKDSAIVITTRRFTQYIPPHPKLGRAYDIGSFIIFIRPELSIRPTGVVAETIFIKQRDRGAFIKAYIDDASCLGNTEDKGLNFATEKLLAEGAIVPVVHAIFTFLKYDSAVPVDRNAGTISKAEYRESSNIPFDSRAREKAKAEFVAIMKRARIERLTSESRKKLAEIKAKMDESLKEFRAVRTKFSEAREFAGFLEARLSRAKNEAHDMFEALAGHPLFISAETDGQLRVWLYDGSTFKYPALLIFDGVMPRLLSPQVFPGIFSDHTAWYDTSEMREKMLAYVASGDYISAIELISMRAQMPIPDFGG